MDSLDIVIDQGKCKYWLFSADHEAHFGGDPGDIYMIDLAAGGPPTKVIDQSVHLGISKEADIDAFELAWIVRDQGAPWELALLFSVDDDDPLTQWDESGGLGPNIIYASLLTGGHFPYVAKPLPDDIDALTVWAESLEPTPGLDFGDAPDSDHSPRFPTLLVNDGARHVIDPGFHLGPAGTIRVSQESVPGAGDFDANVLGYVDPYTSGLTTSGYYQYGTPYGASFNGPAPELVSDRSHLFLVNAADGLSLFVVHDKPVDGSGGSSAMHWELTGDTLALLAEDDPGEPVNVTGGGTIIDSSHGWSVCCTDGYAVGSLDGSWTMVGAFTNDVAVSGMNQWVVHDVDGDEIVLAFQTDRRVRLEYFDGGGIDAEPDGQPGAWDGAGDDLGAPTDDEDGVRFLTRVIPGEDAMVEVVLTSADGRGGYLNAWMDFDGSSTWTEADDRIFHGEPLNPGVNVLSFPVPLTAHQGISFSRFRLSSQRDLSYDGPADDGEVEDYRVFIRGLDWGDAPEPAGAMGYPTTWARDGARHAVYVSAPWLGDDLDNPDRETDGQPDPDALGDDNALDDEDGVVVLGLVAGELGQIEVQVHGGGVVEAWIDFNGDMIWQHPAEQIHAGYLAAGVHTLTFPVPLDAVPGETFGRFRISTDGGLLPTGLADDG
ncbi:MAG: GEVED domain-containing protein, partial [Planctomycetota bacterium]